MLLERRACRHISGIVRCDIRQRHAAQFGGETRTERNDVHRQVLPGFLSCRAYGKTVAPATRPGVEMIRTGYCLRRGLRDNSGDGYSGTGGGFVSDIPGEAPVPAR